MYRLVLDCLIFSPHIPTVPARMTSTSIRPEMMLSARPNQGVSGLEDFRGRRQGGSIGRTWVKSGLDVRLWPLPLMSSKVQMIRADPWEPSLSESQLILKDRGKEPKQWLIELKVVSCGEEEGTTTPKFLTGLYYCLVSKLCSCSILIF